MGDLDGPNLWGPPTPGDLTGPLTGPLANPIVPRLPSSQRPPNPTLAGNTGLKNHLKVFELLWNILRARISGYKALTSLKIQLPSILCPNYWLS